jgi:hypothetical protein
MTKKISEMTYAKGIQSKRMSFAVVISIAAGVLIIFSGLIAWSQYTTTTSNSIFDFGGTDWWSGSAGEEEEGRGIEVAMIRLPSVSVVTGLTSGVVVSLAGAMMYFKPQRKRIWGIMVLIFSVLALLSMGGFFVFGVGLGVIGGILSIVDKQIK